MQIDWSKYLPTMVDIGERLAKTFAGGFIVGSGLPAAALDIAASQINWEHGLDVGLGTTAVSAIFSLASLKVNNPGASLSRFVAARWPAKS